MICRLNNILYYSIIIDYAAVYAVKIYYFICYHAGIIIQDSTAPLLPPRSSSETEYNRGVVQQHSLPEQMKEETIQVQQNVCIMMYLSCSVIVLCSIIAPCHVCAST